MPNIIDNQVTLLNKILDETDNGYRIRSITRREIMTSIARLQSLKDHIDAVKLEVFQHFGGFK